MDLLYLILYVVAVPATVILILQTILLLFGLGNGGADADSDFDVDTDLDTDIDVDADGIPDSAELEMDNDLDGAMGDSGLRLFTVRGMVAFFAVGGWAGIAALELGAPHWAAVLIAVLFGLAALILVAFFFKWAMKLRSNGSLNIKNAVGKTGEVYMTVPANAKGRGKVNVIIQERYTELDAITKGDSDLKYGTRVKITALADGNTVVVEAE